jgi:hypothetical protein
VFDRPGGIFKIRSMSDSPRAHNYRDQAKRSREEAEKASSSDLRAQWEEIARQYDLLADSVEQEGKRRLEGSWR